MVKVEANNNKKSVVGSQNKVKVDKYLTDIKELPPESKEAEKQNLPAKVESSDAQKKYDESKVEKTSVKKENNVVVEDGEKKSKLPISAKDAILGIINFISVVLLIILLFKLPEKSAELKELIIDEVKSRTRPVSQLTDIQEDKDKKGDLETLFLDESGIVDFVNEVEKLKVEGGAIQKVTFASQKAVKDRLGNYGVPVVIELSGNWIQIGSDLEKIQKLPFIFRAANIEAERSKDDPNVIVFKYGAFLYVNNRLGENK